MLYSVLLPPMGYHALFVKGAFAPVALSKTMAVGLHKLTRGYSPQREFAALT